MSSQRAFSPTYGKGVTISGSTSSAGAEFSATGGFHSIRVSNPTSAVAFFRTGIGAQTATNADQAVLPGESVVIPMGSGHTHVAAILASGSGNLYAMPGNGG